MAWTDQCKIAFKTNADHQIWTQKGRKNITKVLKKLSEESGVPQNTLRRWYYEKEEQKNNKIANIENSIKNDTTEKASEIKEENTTIAADAANEEPVDRPKCTKCGKGVELRRGKPYQKGAKYYGLCRTCRLKATIINDAIKLANENGEGEWVICPKCNHNFLYQPKGGANG